MRKFLPLSLLSLALAGAAWAVPTSTGSFTASLPGTTVSAQRELAGVTLFDDVTYMTSARGAIIVTIQRRVTQGADGTLTFAWRLINDANSKAALTGLTLRGFPNKVYDANWRVDGLGTVALSSLSGDGAPDSSYTWTLASPLQPGQESRFFFLKTSAKSFTKSPATITAFGPMVSTTAVPTPSPVF